MLPVQKTVERAQAGFKVVAGSISAIKPPGVATTLNRWLARVNLVAGLLPRGECCGVWDDGVNDMRSWWEAQLFLYPSHPPSSSSNACRSLGHLLFKVQDALAIAFALLLKQSHIGLECVDRAQCC